MATTIRKRPPFLSRTPTFFAAWILHLSSNFSARPFEAAAPANSLTQAREFATLTTTSTVVRTPKITNKMAFEKVPADSLFVSEPNPAWFGNGANEPKNPTWTNANWLKSRFHFSFAEYHDPKRSSFGVLRVMNDDLVQPARGFGTHPHKNMEICTYVIQGELTHKDSMGTQESLGRGSIQFMTAGMGVQHSEFNKSPTADLRFIQMWINPRHMGLPPNYGSMRGDSVDMTDKWAHLVSDVENSVSTPVKINQDANIYVSELGPGKTINFKVEQGRQAYYLQMEGSAKVTGAHGDAEVEQHAAARIRGENELAVHASDDTGAHVLIVEMAA